MTKKTSEKKKNLTFYKPDNNEQSSQPLFSTNVQAGFPSPADDYLDLKLDLNKYLIKHPSATFYVKVSGNSMKNANILDGDILIVDKAKIPKNDDIAVCVINGEFTVKRLLIKKNEIYLIAENPEYKAIKITEFSNFEVWGVITYIIHKV